MKIDAHQHFWSYNPQDYGWITEDLSILKKDYLPQDLEPILNENGVEGCIAVQARQSLEETTWLLKLANQNKFIKGVVGWVDLCSDTIADQLIELSVYPKLVGVRHVLHDEPDDNFMLREDFLNGIEKLQQKDLTYDILIFPKHLKTALSLVRQFPNQKFVIDHLAKPSIKTGDFLQWSMDILEFKNLPNVWCKVSGMVTEANWKNIETTNFDPLLDKVFEAFPQERIMFGSDWPVCNLAADYGRVLSIVDSYLKKNSQYDTDLIMGQNCMDFYGITNNKL